MSKKLTSEDKKKFIEASLPKLIDEQKKIVLGTMSIDAQYTKVQRYIRIKKDSRKQEQQHLLELATKYCHILEGLDCLDQKLWTDEKKIRAFSDLLDSYCDKCVKLVEDNNRKHLERLKAQRAQRQKEYEAEQAKYDKEIEELEMKLGNRPYPKVVNAEVSLIP